MDYTLNDSSLKSSTRYLWDKLLIKKILKTLNDFKNEEKNSGRNFTLFLIEIKMAYDEFLGSVKDLPMIMSCRARGDNDSKFGGEQCARFANSFCMVSCINAPDKELWRILMSMVKISIFL